VCVCVCAYACSNPTFGKHVVSTDICIIIKTNTTLVQHTHTHTLIHTISLSHTQTQTHTNTHACTHAHTFWSISGAGMAYEDKLQVLRLAFQTNPRWRMLTHCCNTRPELHNTTRTFQTERIHSTYQRREQRNVRHASPGRVRR